MFHLILFTSLFFFNCPKILQEERTTGQPSSCLLEWHKSEYERRWPLLSCSDLCHSVGEESASGEEDGAPKSQLRCICLNKVSLKFLSQLFFYNYYEICWSWVISGNCQYILSTCHFVDDILVSEIINVFARKKSICLFCRYACRWGCLWLPSCLLPPGWRFHIQPPQVSCMI